MGVTAFLSMWINNSASANIMIPTAIAIVNELKTYQQTTKQTSTNSGDKSGQNITTIVLNDFKCKKYSSICTTTFSMHIFWF